MIIVNLETIKKQDLRGLITVIPNKYCTKGEYFQVTRDIYIKLSNDHVICIESGFTFDGSSVPWHLRWFMNKYGPFLFASLIHDWLYKKDYLRNVVGLRSARKFADKEMFIWSTAIHNKTIFSKIDNYLRYLAVRLFGKKIYKK